MKSRIKELGLSLVIICISLLLISVKKQEHAQIQYGDAHIESKTNEIGDSLQKFMVIDLLQDFLPELTSERSSTQKRSIFEYSNDPAHYLKSSD